MDNSLETLLKHIEDSFEYKVYRGWGFNDFLETVQMLCGRKEGFARINTTSMISDASAAGKFSPVQTLVCPVSGFSAADLGSNFTASTESSNMGRQHEGTIKHG